MATTSKPTSTSAVTASVRIRYRSQLPNTIINGLELPEMYSKSPLTVVTFLSKTQPESEAIRERTKELMLNFSLVRSIQFVELEMEQRPWYVYNISVSKLPTIVFCSRTGEIERQICPSPGRYEEKVRFYQRHWLKSTIKKPLSLQIGGAAFLKFRADAEKIVGSAKVVVLIHGKPDATWCHQSVRAMDILRIHGIQFRAYNVLHLEGMFRAFQDLAPYKITFPHIYLNGVMIGGMPVLIHLISNNTLKEVFELKFNELLVSYLPEYFMPTFPTNVLRSHRK